MNVSRTSCFSIELAKIRIPNALTSAQHCFKLRSAAPLGPIWGIGAMLLIGKFGAVGERLFVHVTGRRVIPRVWRPTTGNLSVLTTGIIIWPSPSDRGWPSPSDRGKRHQVTVDNPVYPPVFFTGATSITTPWPTRNWRLLTGGELLRSINPISAASTLAAGYWLRTVFITSMNFARNWRSSA